MKIGLLVQHFPLYLTNFLVFTITDLIAVAIVAIIIKYSLALLFTIPSMIPLTTTAAQKV